MTTSSNFYEPTRFSHLPDGERVRGKNLEDLVNFLASQGVDVKIEEGSETFAYSLKPAIAQFNMYSLLPPLPIANRDLSKLTVMGQLTLCYYRKLFGKGLKVHSFSNQNRVSVECPFVESAQYPNHAGYIFQIHEALSQLGEAGWRLEIVGYEDLSIPQPIRNSFWSPRATSKLSIAVKLPYE
jgi:hypothetical protein